MAKKKSENFVSNEQIYNEVKRIKFYLFIIFLILLVLGSIYIGYTLKYNGIHILPGSDTQNTEMQLALK